MHKHKIEDKKLDLLHNFIFELNFIQNMQLCKANLKYCCISIFTISENLTCIIRATYVEGQYTRDTSRTQTLKKLKKYKHKTVNCNTFFQFNT